MQLQSYILPVLFSVILLQSKCKDPIGNLPPPDKNDKEVLVDEGWHYRQGTNGDKEKFFAIGAWRIPGYVENSEDIEAFKKQARNLNVVFTPPQNFNAHLDKNDQKIYMHIMPSLYLINDYLKNIPDVSDKGIEGGYYKTQYLKKQVHTKEFKNRFDAALNAEITRSKNKYPNTERAYLPVDEVAMGLGGSHWFVPPSVGDFFYDRINFYDPNSIVFADLSGHGKGSSFFFEERYLKTHAAMPQDPPYEAVSESARIYAEDAVKTGKGAPLIAFMEGYDGVPAYQFKGSSYSYNDYTLDNLKRTHYENIKRYAEAYKGNGNVFGINAFRDFAANPVLAGVTVDAIRDGLNDPKIPIWIFYDGNGYAKAGSVSVEDYVKQVKCQMYTSIIHGSTGVFFWNDPKQTTAVWDALQPVLKEMRVNVDILKLKTLDKKSKDDLHYIIKKDEAGQKYIIASNTSKTEVIDFKVEGVNKLTLSPLEVYVSPMN